MLLRERVIFWQVRDPLVDTYVGQPLKTGTIIRAVLGRVHPKSIELRDGRSQPSTSAKTSSRNRSSVVAGLIRCSDREHRPNIDMRPASSISRSCSACGNRVTSLKSRAACLGRSAELPNFFAS